MTDLRIDYVVEQIRIRISQIKEKIETLWLDPNTASMEEIQKHQETLEDFNARINAASNISEDIKTTLGNYNNQADIKLKGALQEKVDKTINTLRLEKLDEEQVRLETQKIGLFGRLLGDEKIRGLRLDVINRKKRIYTQQKAGQLSGNSSIREIVSKIHEYSVSENEGIRPKELEEILKNIGRVYKYDDKQARILAQERMKNLPAVIPQKQSIFGKRKREVEKLEKEKGDLHTEFVTVQLQENKILPLNRGNINNRIKKQFLRLVTYLSIDEDEKANREFEYAVVRDTEELFK